MQPGQKRRTFLYAGIGFVLIGVVSLVLVYLYVYYPSTKEEQAPESTKFNLEEIHRTPLTRHDHVVLSIITNGESTTVPEGVGMLPQYWFDHSLDKYGPSGISPLHTHDTSGTIHIESTVNREYTVGELLKVIGIESNTINGTVNGNVVPNLLNHAMKGGEQIRIEITTTD